MKAGKWIKRVGWALIVIAAPSAQAGGGGLIPVRIGSNIDLNTGVTTNVGGVSVAYNGMDNEYRVAWFDSRIVGQNDVYAQRVAAGGTLLGDNVTIIAGSPSQTDTAIAHDPLNNQYLITWRNQSGGPGSPGFNHAFGAIVSATGGMIGQERDISNGGLEPTLAYNSADNQYFLEARNFAGGGTGGIRGQRVSADGQLVGGGLTIATSGAPAPAGQVAYNSNANQYLATWRDQSARNLKGRIINADGTFATGPFLISSLFPESGLAASVAFDPVNDHYLVVFSEFSAGDVFGQFLDSLGGLEGDPFTIVESTTRLNPFVVYDPVHQAYLVAWYDSGTGVVSVQLVGDDGISILNPIPISGPAGGRPRIAANATDGGFIVTWRDSTNSPSRVDVLAQIIGIWVEGPYLGDMNCDGRADAFDIDAFVLALTNPGEYNQQYWWCDPLRGDLDCDGDLDAFDIDPFVVCLTTGQCECP